MSLKIHNGFKIETSDFSEIQPLLVSIEKEIRPIVKNINIYNISKQIISSYIFSILAKSDQHFNNYIKPMDLFNVSDVYNLNIKSKSFEATDILTYLSEVNVAFSMLENPFVSKFDTSVSFFLHPLNGKTIGYHNSNNKILDALLRTNKNLKDYYYTNSSIDTPKGITEKEWQERRTDWEEHVYRTPSKKPFIYEIIKPDSIFMDFLDFFEKDKIKENSKLIILDLNKIIADCCIEYSFFCHDSTSDYYDYIKHAKKLSIQVGRDEDLYFNDTYKSIKEEIKQEDWIELLMFILKNKH